MKRENFYKPGNHFNAASEISKKDEWTLLGEKEGLVQAAGTISDNAFELLINKYPDLINLDNETKEITTNLNTWNVLKNYETNNKQQLIFNKKLNMNINTFVQIGNDRGIAVFDFEDKSNIDGKNVKMKMYTNTDCIDIIFNVETNKYINPLTKKESEIFKFKPFEISQASINAEHEEKDLEEFVNRNLKEELDDEIFLEYLKNKGMENISYSTETYMIIIDVSHNNKNTPELISLLESLNFKLNTNGAYELKTPFLNFKKKMLNSSLKKQNINANIK